MGVSLLQQQSGHEMGEEVGTRELRLGQAAPSI